MCARPIVSTCVQPPSLTVASCPSANDSGQDPLLVQLDGVPAFLPILKSSLPGYSGPPDSHMQEQLEPVFLEQLLKRFRAHLTASAKHVAKGQGDLGLALKKMEQLYAGAYSRRCVVLPQTMLATTDVCLVDGASAFRELYLVALTHDDHPTAAIAVTRYGGRNSKRAPTRDQAAGVAQGG